MYVKINILMEMKMNWSEHTEHTYLEEFVHLCHTGLIQHSNPWAMKQNKRYVMKGDQKACKLEILVSSSGHLRLLVQFLFFFNFKLQHILSILTQKLLKVV